jgi:type I restriction enzyme, S subunit
VSFAKSAEMMSRPLPKGWTWVPLGQYVENHDGRRVPISRSERESRQGAFPYYGASGVIDTIDGFTHEGEFVLIGEDGANLLTRSKPLAFLTRGKVWVNNHAHVLRCKPGFSNAYLAYYINSINLSAYVTGTAQPKLSQSMMNKIPIPVAPPEQQTEIVAEIEKQFSRLDEAVANLQRVKANLKRYKASVLKAAIEGRLVETEASIAQREGRSYETGEQLLQRILEDRKTVAKGKRVVVNWPDADGLPDCPEGWALTTCDAAITSIDAGASFKCEERPPVPGEIGVLKVSALTWGTYDENESKTCKDEGRIEEKYLVREGDFLFSRANTIELVGACVIVGKTTKQLMLSDKTLRFKLNEKLLPEWLQICLRCKFGRDEIERLATGNQESMRNIGQERIRQIRIPLPPLSDQKRIVAEVDRHLSIIRGVFAEVDVNLQRAQALRQAILAKAFLGG